MNKLARINDDGYFHKIAKFAEIYDTIGSSQQQTEM
jgi:hypothetical protein